MSPLGAASGSAQPPRRARTRLAAACIACAIVALLLAILAGYAQRALLDPEQFANRATAALRDERVRTLVAAEVTDDLVLDNAGDLVAARPLIERVTADVVGGPAFLALFRAAVLDLHRATFGRDRDTVTLTLADAGTVVAGALETLRPDLARRIRADTHVTLLQRRLDDRAASLAGIADRVELLAVVSAALALVLAAAGLALAPDRRRAVAQLGTGAALTGIVIVVGYSVARSIVIERVSGPEQQDAARGVWDAFLGDLRGAGWLLAGSGAVIAAAAASLLRPFAIEPALLRLRRWVRTEPERPALRVLRALLLIAAGVVVVARPAAVLELIATLAGVFLVYAGVTSLLRLVYRPEPAAELAARRRRGGRLVVTGIAATLVAGACAVFVASGGVGEAATPVVAGCNGHRELCDVRLDRVVLPATHNAMSAPLPGWYSSQQDAPIADQLADGIRGLLIDTHYGDRLGDGKVRTDLGDTPERLAAEDGVSDETFQAALRLRERLGFGGKGERGMYLCHSFCELGAMPLSDALDAIHDFLVTHPGEVLVVINQDYVQPADFVDAVTRAGLAELAYRPPASGAWATLEELVRDDRRVVFLAENEAGAAPWYQLAYDGITEETPFSFRSGAQLVGAGTLAAGCRPNRGGDGSPLFLVNHWVTTDPLPRPSNAAQVNARRPLLRRARECERIRGHLPNLLAVDFYRQGDLFGVVDELNGVS